MWASEGAREILSVRVCVRACVWGGEGKGGGDGSLSVYVCVRQ